jgi:hypothetical protein
MSAETGEAQMPHETSFSVRTAEDFFAQIVLPTYQEFVEHNSSVRHALLSIITAYHMGEWVYQADWRKAIKWKTAAQEAGVTDDFEMARMVTNGTKHFEPRIVTRTQTGFSSGFSNAFARPLLIEKPDESDESADNLLDRLIRFWKDQRANKIF